MSVFTPLSTDDVIGFMRQFELGDVTAVQGIRGGSENTNYFVDCGTGRYVLTLIERGPVQDLPFFVDLLDCLQGAGLPVPYAFRNREGKAILSLKNKPALLQPRLGGEHPEQVNASQCAALGTLLATLHNASCGLRRSSDRGPSWVLSQSVQMLQQTWQQDSSWLQPCLQALQQWYDQAPALPQSVIHGDLFRDNAMFEGNRLSGIIDFYNAATGWTLFDLAVCVNDWCIDIPTDTPVINAQRVDALLQAYNNARPLLQTEYNAWPFVLQLAALRFWLSRQQYLEQHRDQPGVLLKDPEYFRQLLKLHAGGR